MIYKCYHKLNQIEFQVKKIRFNIMFQQIVWDWLSSKKKKQLKYVRKVQTKGIKFVKLPNFFLDDQPDSIYNLAFEKRITWV